MYCNNKHLTFTLIKSKHLNPQYIDGALIWSVKSKVYFRFSAICASPTPQQTLVTTDLESSVGSARKTSPLTFAAPRV